MAAALRGGLRALAGVCPPLPPPPYSAHLVHPQDLVTACTAVDPAARPALPEILARLDVLVGEHAAAAGPI